jgi:hypothetical protein
MGSSINKKAARMVYPSPEQPLFSIPKTQGQHITPLNEDTMEMGLSLVKFS